MKDQVIHFLKNKPDDVIQQFNKAFELYRRSPFCSNSIIRRCNLGFTERNLETLLYDLQKGFKITNVEVLNTPILSKDDIKTDLNKLQEQTKISDDFPFLRNKDCPDELKILVNDKITAWKEFCKKHKELVEKYFKGEITLETKVEESIKLQNLIKETVNNFELNKDIYEELDYYKENHKILGKHPILKEALLEQEIKELSIVDLVKRKDRNIYKIARAKREIKGLKDKKAIETRQHRINNWKNENIMIEKYISV